MSEAPTQALLRGGRYDGRPFPFAPGRVRILIETLTEIHIYEVTADTDETGRPIFVFKAKANRPKN